jgi:hypothetical protein
VFIGIQNNERKKLGQGPIGSRYDGPIENKYIRIGRSGNLMKLMSMKCQSVYYPLLKGRKSAIDKFTL